MPDLIIEEIIYVHKKKREEDSQSPLRILDLGSSSGELWNNKEIRKVIDELNAEITMLDINSDLLNDAITLASPPPQRGARFLLEVGLLPSCLRKVAHNQYDLVILIDLIEHLSKSDGYKLLYEIDRIALHSSLLVTPNGFVWQPPALNNEYNAHISRSSTKELKVLGWRDIRGLIGLRYFWGPYSQPKNQPRNFVMWEFYALQKIIVSYFPKFAFSILAKKRVKNPRNEVQ